MSNASDTSPSWSVFREHDRTFLEALQTPDRLDARLLSQSKRRKWATVATVTILLFFFGQFASTLGPIAQGRVKGMPQVVQLMPLFPLLLMLFGALISAAIALAAHSEIRALMIFKVLCERKDTH